MEAHLGRSGCSSEGQHCPLRPTSSCPVTDQVGQLGTLWPQVGHSLSPSHLLHWGLCIHQGGAGSVRDKWLWNSLGEYMQTHGVQVAVFVFSGINYPLQMVMKSFVTQWHENRRCQELPSVGWSPGAGRAVLSPELTLEKPLHDPRLGPLSAHGCIREHLPDSLLASLLGISYNSCRASSRLLKALIWR